MNIIKTLTLAFGLLCLTGASVAQEELSIQQQIAQKQAELNVLQLQNAEGNTALMLSAMTQMVAHSSDCVARGVADKGMFTRTATVAKACGDQSKLGAFAICAATVGQTGDTRDLNQCVAMMRDKDNEWANVALRGLGIAGTLAGGKLASDIILKGAVPLGLAAINKEPAEPLIVDPVVLEQPEALVIEPTIVEPTVIQVPAFEAPVL